VAQADRMHHWAQRRRGHGQGAVHLSSTRDSGAHAGTTARARYTCTVLMRAAVMAVPRPGQQWQ
jgi:hypothetical protein